MRSGSSSWTTSRRDPGSKVLALCNGVFGDGIADMAESIGAEVKRFSVAYNTTQINYNEFEKAVIDFEPLMKIGRAHV